MSQELQSLREQVEVERLRLELQDLQGEAQHARQLREGIGTAWGWGWPDPFEPGATGTGAGGMPGAGALLAGNKASRRDGRFMPFFWSELNLDMARGQARWLAVENGLAQGALNTLRNFVIRTGFTYEGRPARKCAKNDVARGLARQLDTVVEEFCDLNLFSQVEKSVCVRAIRDGEVFLRSFVQPDGTTLVRFVEPEQVGQPPGDSAESLFGVEVAPGDVACPLAYHCTYDGLEFERVPADEISFLKRNTDECVRRGLSDFYSTGESLDGIQKLLTNLRVGGALQAAIPWIEQYDGATAAAVQAQIASRRDQHRSRQPDPVTGQVTDYQRFKAGTILKIGAGKQYLPAPLAGSTTQHTAIVQACLRAVGARWNMPEYMISGDGSNANYASTLVAGSPFVTAIECEQDTFRLFFLRVLWIAVRAAAEMGRFVWNGRVYTFEEVQQYCDIHATPPRVAIASKQEEFAIDRGLTELGALSLQTLRSRNDLDDDQERANLRIEPLTRLPGRATDLDASGNPVKGSGSGQGQGQGGASDPVLARQVVELQTDFYGGRLPRAAVLATAIQVLGLDPGKAEALFPEVAPRKLTDDGQQPGPEAGAGSVLGEGLQPPEEERLLQESWLLEAGFTGVKTYSNGAKHYYVDGRHVKGAAGYEAATGKKAAAAPEAPVRGRTEPHTARPSVDQVHALANKARGGSAAHKKAFAEALPRLTVKELGQLKQRLGLKASGLKADLVAKIKERALAGAAKAKPAAKPTVKPAAKSKPAPSPADLSAALDAATSAQPFAGGTSALERAAAAKTPSERLGALGGMDTAILDPIENRLPGGLHQHLGVYQNEVLRQADKEYRAWDRDGRQPGDGARRAEHLRAVASVVRERVAPGLRRLAADGVQLTSPDGTPIDFAAAADFYGQHGAAVLEKVAAEMGGAPRPNLAADAGSLLSYFDAHPNARDNLVSLADLADATGWDTPRLHAAVQALRQSGQVSAVSAEGRHGITARERAAMLPPDAEGEHGLLHISRRANP